MNTKEGPKGESVVGVVVYSPVIHLGLFLFAFLVHIFYPVQIVASQALLYPGLFLILLSPALIFWSQRAVRRFAFSVNEGTEGPLFRIGPYRFSRNPTYIGLVLLTFGFSLVANSLPLLLGALLAFHIVALFVVPREEALLEKKYGDEYRVYKDSVRRWF